MDWSEPLGKAARGGINEGLWTLGTIIGADEMLSFAGVCKGTLGMACVLLMEAPPERALLLAMATNPEFIPGPIPPEPDGVEAMADFPALPDFLASLDISSHALCCSPGLFARPRRLELPLRCTEAGRRTCTLGRRDGDGPTILWQSRCWPLEKIVGFLGTCFTLFFFCLIHEQIG